MAVSFHSSGLACTASTIFFDEAFEQIQLRRSRVAVDQAARLDERNRRQRAVLDVRVQISVSWICAVRTAALAMIEVSYWNGLQMLQYSSVLAPDRAVVELVRSGT